MISSENDFLAERATHSLIDPGFPTFVPAILGFDLSNEEFDKLVQSQLESNPSASSSRGCD